MKEQRRNHRMTISLALSAVIVLCGGLIGEMNIVRAGTVKSTPDVVIYSGTYPGWPWIDRAPDGTLMCVWREGTRHTFSPEGKKMISVSHDNGATWSAASVVQDAPDIDDRGGGILALSNNQWIVSYFTTDDSSVSRAWTTQTADAGQTWSDPVLVNGGVTHNTATRSAPLKLSNGELLLPYYGNPGETRPLAAISNDNGQSWTTYTLPGADGFAGNEWSVVEMPGNTLAGIIRNDKSEDGSLWMTKSTDWGRTWSSPQKTNLRDSSGLTWKSPAQIFMHNGKPWVLYDDKRYVSVSLATTDDANLLDWNTDEQIQAFQYKADGTRIYDGGYPSGVRLSDGRMLIVDYYIDGGKRQIVGYYATLPTPEPGPLAMLSIAAAVGSAYIWKKRGKSAVRGKE